MSEVQQLKAKDFKSDQEVRWCPGCGDYSIISGVQKTLADIGVPRENVVMVSGIGCSSRFPYYMETYGFHGIHGRANAIATGVKVANPDLDVWVITGDGDGLSIGGNHMIHSLRRNVNMKIILFNNEIYGLTKGQYSPTSPQGLKTKTSPFGSVDAPFNPVQLALGCGATFVARTMDVRPKHMKEVLRAAAEHKGAAFVEVWQNCVIFNDGAYKSWTDKSVRDEMTVDINAGEPMVFGKDRDRGIRLVGTRPEVVELGNGVTESDLLVHDETDATLGFILSRMFWPEYPVPLGVFRRVKKPTHHQLVAGQIELVRADKGEGVLRDLLFTNDTWEVT
jgi:2-oxoglutarate ferredoxin oxidoreductase subunit beta